MVTKTEISRDAFHSLNDAYEAIVGSGKDVWFDKTRAGIAAVRNDHPRATGADWIELVEDMLGYDLQAISMRMAVRIAKSIKIADATEWSYFNRLCEGRA